MRVRAKSPRVDDEPQPRLFEEIFSNLPAVRQPCQEAVETTVEGIVDGIERVRIPGPQAFDELKLEVAIHPRY